jgi:hypothetical protein
VGDALAIFSPPGSPWRLIFLDVVARAECFLGTGFENLALTERLGGSMEECLWH